MERLSGIHVRLRSRSRGTYLHADENGVSVSLSAERASLRTVWRVESVRLRHLRGNYISLQGAAYARYLAVSPGNAQHGHGCSLRQNMFYGEQTDVDALWMPLRVWGGARNEVRLRHCRHSARHIGVTAQNPDDCTTRWMIEIVPCRREPPVLPAPVPHLGFRFPAPSRTILYVRSDDHGQIDPASWARMDFPGRSVLNLRADLARLLGEANPSSICLFAWTGYTNPKIPLIMDLPSDINPVVIGVLKTRSPAALALLYPDVDAQ